MGMGSFDGNGNFYFTNILAPDARSNSLVSGFSELRLFDSRKTSAQ
jgi:hypothetical protein